MDAVDFRVRCSNVEPGSPEAAALAGELAEDARYPARVAVRSYLPAEGQTRETGKILLDALQEFSLAPLAEASAFSDAAMEVWTVRFLSEEFAAFRRRTAAAFQPLLANKGNLPSPLPAGLREFAVKPRVCDLACLLLQRLVLGAGALSNFLNLGLAERDARIDAFQQSPQFQQFFDKQA
jgi:hypothetical protein